MKTQFFPRQVIPKILFALHSDYTGDTPYQLWFDFDKSLRLKPNKTKQNKTKYNILLKLCRKIVSSWLKKPTLEIFQYILGVFLSFFLIRAGDWLRMNYH